jgi:hypothetical protein
VHRALVGSEQSVAPFAFHGAPTAIIPILNGPDANAPAGYRWHIGNFISKWAASSVASLESSACTANGFNSHPT